MILLILVLDLLLNRWLLPAPSNMNHSLLPATHVLMILLVLDLVLNRWQLPATTHVLLILLVLVLVRNRWLLPAITDVLISGWFWLWCRTVCCFQQWRTR